MSAVIQSIQSDPRIDEEYRLRLAKLPVAEVSINHARREAGVEPLKLSMEERAKFLKAMGEYCVEATARATGVQS